MSCIGFYLLLQCTGTIDRWFDIIVIRKPDISIRVRIRIEICVGVAVAVVDVELVPKVTEYSGNSQSRGGRLVSIWDLASNFIAHRHWNPFVEIEG